MPDRPAEPARPAVPRGLPPEAAAAADEVVASFQRGEGRSSSPAAQPRRRDRPEGVPGG